MARGSVGGREGSSSPPVVMLEGVPEPPESQEVEEDAELRRPRGIGRVWVC